MTKEGGPLANEFAQVREAIDTYVADVCPDPQQMAGYVNEWYAALARIEEHTHNTEKALEWIATGKHEDFEATSDAEWALGMGHVAGAALGKHPLAARFAARAALSAGEGTPA